MRSQIGDKLIWNPKSAIGQIADQIITFRTDQ